MPFFLSSPEKPRCDPTAFRESLGRKMRSVIESTAGIRATHA